jgi:hypothetical protein
LKKTDFICCERAAIIRYLQMGKRRFPLKGIETSTGSQQTNCASKLNCGQNIKLGGQKQRKLVDITMKHDGISLLTIGSCFIINRLLIQYKLR